ncbi:MAG: hypothetical protein V3T35_04820 [Spirochaetia bacterium]
MYFCIAAQTPEHFGDPFQRTGIVRVLDADFLLRSIYLNIRNTLNLSPQVFR